jgi:hypothetical protein
MRLKVERCCHYCGLKENTTCHLCKKIGRFNLVPINVCFHNCKSYDRKVKEGYELMFFCKNNVCLRRFMLHFDYGMEENEEYYSSDSDSSSKSDISHDAKKYKLPYILIKNPDISYAVKFK